MHLTRAFRYICRLRRAGRSLGLLALVLAPGLWPAAQNAGDLPPVNRPLPVELSEAGGNYRPHVNAITEENSPLLEELFAEEGGVFEQVISNPGAYKLQIIFSQIRRDRKNRPYLKHHTFNLDTLGYFFPASMVKLPCAALALEKFHTLDIEGLDFTSKMLVRPGRGACHRGASRAEYSRTFGYPSIRHYLKDALVASGNVAYDRLYEFVGQQPLNETLHARGYSSCNITQRYGSHCTLAENRYTQPIDFYDEYGELIYHQPAQTSDVAFKQKVRSARVGKGKKMADGSVAPVPYDFNYRNFVSLKDLHEMMMAIMLPVCMPRDRHFRLRPDDYKLLHRYMSMLPTESDDPRFDPGYYTCHRMKYLLYGTQGRTPDPEIRIFNKVGMALGFLTDCAYIVDFETRTEFFLSATIWVNANGIAGDGKYEYFSIGMPFLRRLGEILLEHEREAQRKYTPDLSFYRHDYLDY